MPLKMISKKAYIGLDLGHYSIKAMMLEPFPSGYKVTRVEQILTPQGAVKEGVITDASAVSAALKELLRQAKFPTNLCHISVAGPTVVVRTVRIPRMTESMLRKSIRFEAGRYIPNSVEDSYIEFEILGETEDGQMDVMMVAAPRELVDSRSLVCALAGLDVESVDLEPFATYRSLVEANFGVEIQNETFALVDLGFSSTKVSVVSRGQFAMTRSISQGANILTDALGKYFKLSFEDAEEGKMQLDVRGLLNEGAPIENPPLRVIQPHLDDLIREMRRSFNYYQSQSSIESNANVPAPGNVSWVLLSGGGAKLAGIAEYMSNRLGLKVYSAGVFDNPRFAYVGEAIYGQGADLAVASGLAMRGLAKTA